MIESVFSHNAGADVAGSATVKFFSQVRRQPLSTSCFACFNASLMFESSFEKGNKGKLTLFPCFIC